MKKIKIFALIISFATCNCIYAATDWNRHLGPYAEINLGTNLYYAGIISSSGTCHSAGIEGIGWSIAAGNHFTNIFALEAGFMQNYLHDNYSHTNVPYLTTRFDVPVVDRINFIGKLGAMYASAPTKGGIVLPYVGIGSSYALTPKVDFQVQYQGAVYGIAGAGLVSAGLTYHFN